MKNYLVTIRIADGSNYETTIEATSINNAYADTMMMILSDEIELGEIICILLSE